MTKENKSIRINKWLYPIVMLIPIIAILSTAFYFYKKNWEAKQESLIESQVNERLEEVISQYRVEADKEGDEIIYTLKRD